MSGVTSQKNQTGSSGWYIPGMLRYTHGDLLSSDVEALVNTVNTVGVMGKGLAAQFKARFPENFRAYADACRSGQVVPGRMFVYDTARIVRPRWIINFPTKRHWKSGSLIVDIETGLDDLHRVITDLDVRSVAVPPLGCGLGGLRWPEVQPLIEQKLGGLTAEVLVFLPSGQFR